MATERISRAGGLALLIVLMTGRRVGFGLALAVAASALAALVLYRYVDVGRLGPLPDMHEPSWFGEKTAAAVAEGAVLLAASGLIEAVRHRAAARRSRKSGRLGLAMAGGVVAGLAVAGFAGHTLVIGSGPAHAAALAQRVTIAGNNSLRLMPMTVHLHTGTVRITLRDSGAYPHNVVIPVLGVASPSATGAPGGAQFTFAVTFRHPGRHAFRCPYHASAGMIGTFVVS
ncbi:MAG TPA: plastocyanin/azurin family copper-binding protein [Streptosporangiaceae bacterium]|nr:plastocyanin/azurin family copper-binding protein [Streptosporangiaceae bacterium]